MHRDPDGSVVAATVAFGADRASISGARLEVRRTVDAVAPALTDDAVLVASELVTNAVLHAAGPYEVRVLRLASGGVRIAVTDRSPDRRPAVAGTGLAQMLALDVDEPGTDDLLAVETMTGRGFLVVDAVAGSWGCDVEPGAKVVWAEVGAGSGHHVVDEPTEPAFGDAALLAVPVRLVLSSAANVDDVVREIRLMPPSPDGLGPRVAAALAGAAPVRDPMRARARAAVEEGRRLVDVQVPADEAIAERLQDFLAVADELGERCSRGELLSLPPTDEVVEFRRWCVGEVVAQVDGEPARPAPFPAADPHDPAVVEATGEADALGASALLADVDLSVIDGATHDVVATRTFEAAVAAIGATNLSFCVLAPGTHDVTIAWASESGYLTDVLDAWSRFGLLDDLPASEVIRTGRPMYSRTLRERVARFPVFAETPVIDAGALAVLPLRDFGALVIGFPHERGFGPDELRFMQRLADAAAAAWAAADPPS